MNKSLLIVIVIIILVSGFYIRNVNSSQIDNIAQDKPRNEKPSIPANWKSYEGTTFKSETVPTTKITFKYPPDWTYKQEYAHATVNLGVFFTDSENEKILFFEYSTQSFIEFFYEPQKEFLGNLIPVTIEGKQGYFFKNKYGYSESYYFPTDSGYFAFNTYDGAGISYIKQIIPSLYIANQK